MNEELIRRLVYALDNARTRSAHESLNEAKVKAVVEEYNRAAR